jgi:hypothetical protein
VKVQLGGVPETLLWTLYHRLIEARRPDAILTDPRAVELVNKIGYPFADRFGSGQGGLAQWQAARHRSSPARALDESWMEPADASHGLLITAQGVAQPVLRLPGAAGSEGHAAQAAALHDPAAPVLA